jgi:hypothetical protein
LRAIEIDIGIQIKQNEASFARFNVDSRSMTLPSVSAIVTPACAAGIRVAVTSVKCCSSSAKTAAVVALKMVRALQSSRRPLERFRR